MALIGATTPRTGLKVQAALDEGAYPKGVKIDDKQVQALPLHRQVPPRPELHTATRRTFM